MEVAIRLLNLLRTLSCKKYFPALPWNKGQCRIYDVNFERRLITYTACSLLIIYLIAFPSDHINNKITPNVFRRPKDRTLRLYPWSCLSYRHLTFPEMGIALYIYTLIEDKRSLICLSVEEGQDDAPEHTIASGPRFTQTNGKPYFKYMTPIDLYCVHLNR